MSDLRVCLRPGPSNIGASHGIGRVVHAQYRYLQNEGIQIVEDPERADVLAGHTDTFGMPRVDVLHCHGLYWTGDPGSGDYADWHSIANVRVLGAARTAQCVSVPSQWVSEVFRRDFRMAPHIIGHGIDLDEWHAGGAIQDYILWNKNRGEDVCDPTPAWELANTGIRVVSTFTPKHKPILQNMELLGKLPAEEMRPYIENANLYLATVKETFGIGTLEAMACGVPVLGYDHGGTADLVEHKKSGYLARPGDLSDLVEGYHWLKAHRREASEYARARAAQFTWPEAMRKYADLYRRAHDLYTRDQAGQVAVVITCYNYARYVGDALTSVLNQSYPADEIIVVDDGSTDDSGQVLKGFAHSRLKVVRQDNQGVAAARNNGVALTSAPFVMCLDADDRLEEHYLEACRNALLAHTDAGLSWTGLGLIREDGSLDRDNHWPGPFNWEWQAASAVPPHTTIPTGAMFRRKMWERAGGYRQRYAPGEDAEFYTRGLATGFTAVRATDEALFFYRNHGGGAHKTRTYVAIDDDKPWMRDRQYPAGAPASSLPVVRSYSEPLVSIIMPVGPAHVSLLPRALDSVMGQTFREWETLVINDTGTDLDLPQPYVWAHIHDTQGREGPGAARNLGLDHARAPLVLFLDADDQLMPEALLTLLRAFEHENGRYIYGDWIARTKRDGDKVMPCPEFDPRMALSVGIHAITSLVPTNVAREVKFNPKLPALEDFDFFARLAASGTYGYHVAQPVVVCTLDSAERRTQWLHTQADKQAVEKQVRDQFAMILEGKEPMPGCCGGGGGANVLAVKRALSGDTQNVIQTTPGVQVPDGTTVRMAFIGQRVGAVTYFGIEGRSRQYVGGNNAHDRYADVNKADVAHLEATGDWKVVPPPARAPAPMPRPVEITATKVEAAKSEPVVPVHPVPDPVPAETPRSKRPRKP